MFSTREATLDAGDLDTLTLGQCAESTPAESPLRRALLFAGVRPYLLVGDLVGLLIAASYARLPWLADAAMALTMVWLFALTGLYRSRLNLSILDDLPYLLAGLFAGTGAQLAVLALIDHDVDRTVIAEAGLAVVLVVGVRLLGYGIVRRVRTTGRIRHRTLILGAGFVGARIGQALTEQRQYGLDVVGYLCSAPRVDDDRLPAPLLGNYDDLAATIVNYGVRDVIVSFGRARESEMIDMLRTCDRLDCEIFFVPRLFEMQTTSRDMDHIWGVPLIRLRRPPYRTLAWHVKRLFDICAAGSALLLFSPVMAGVALAVRLADGPGVLFRQERVGLDGRPFTVLKFRSLRPCNDAESRTRWNVADDDRLGRVGRCIRATSLDELPQLFNVLRGEMSLVGPRPERPHFVEEFAGHIPRYMARHRVPAGVTGWAQVNGLRGNTSIADRARFDNFYIENWSLWGDVKILLRTVVSVLRREGG